MKMRALVIHGEARWADAIRNILGGDVDILTLVPSALTADHPFLSAVEVAFLCDSEISARTIAALRIVRDTIPLPTFVLVDRTTPNWEEEILVAGAQAVFNFPPRSRLLRLAMERLQAIHPIPVAEPVLVPAIPPAQTANDDVLTLWRDLSRSMSHSADGPLLLDAYMRKLRDVLRCGRLILYLVDNVDSARNLKCVFVTGADPGPYSAIQLCRDRGVARLAQQRTAVLSRQSLRDTHEVECAARRELDVFGAEVCVPLLARDGLVGVLFVGARIFGSQYSEGELTMLFHLMEELGGMLRAAELQSELRRERQLFASVLSALPIGCAVINKELQVVHANRSMHAYLGLMESEIVTFEHLPQSWAAAAYGTLQGKQSEGIIELNQQTPDGMKQIRLRVATLRSKNIGESQSVLLCIEDITTEARARHDATASSMRALMERAGEQLANEFRNALTPFSTVIQLSAAEGVRGDTSGLTTALTAGMHRLQRRVDNLAYLARRAILPELTSIVGIMRSGRERFEGIVDSESRTRVKWPAKIYDRPLTADPRAVALAIAELLFNAVEAAPNKPVEITIDDDPAELCIRVRNEGSLSPLELGGAFRQAFVSDKATGVGIGLEVASSIANYHGGQLTLSPIGNNATEALLRIPFRPNTH